MPMRKLHEFDDTIIGQTIWGSLQMIAENIALNKNPIDWVMFFAELSEEYGRL